MFNANYSMMNTNYSHMRGAPRRNAYGNSSATYGQSGGRGQIFGRGMFSASYPRGFLAGSSTASGFGIGNVAGFGRNQFMQSHRPPQMRHMFSPANTSNVSESSEPVPICQICHKQGHTINACWYRYGEERYVAFSN